MWNANFPSEVAEHLRASGDVRLITGGDSCHGVVIKKGAAIGAALLHISREDRRSLRVPRRFSETYV